MFDAEKIGKDIWDAIINGALDLVMNLWAFLSSNTLGFIPTGGLITVLVVIVLVVYFMFGFKGLVAFGIAALAVFELQRRSSVGTPKPSKHWPEAVPESKPTKPRKKYPTLQDILRRD
jgi:hypothetical protein